MKALITSILICATSFATTTQNIGSRCLAPTSLLRKHMRTANAINSNIKMWNLEELSLQEESLNKEAVTKLAKKIRLSGFFNYPIIIDKESGVILDGTHRYKAMRELKFKYIPVFEVDLNDPHIQIEDWFPYISNGIDSSNFSKVIKKYDLQKTDSKDALFIYKNDEGTNIYYKLSDKTIDTRLKKHSIYKESSQRISPQAKNIFMQYKLFHEILNQLAPNQKSIKYKEMIPSLNNDSLIVLPPSWKNPDWIKEITKKEGKNKYYLPPKATRFVLKYRPILIHFDLDHLILLNNLEKNLVEEVNQALFDFLNTGHNWGKIEGKKLEIITNRDREYAETLFKPEASIILSQST